MTIELPIIGQDIIDPGNTRCATDPDCCTDTDCC